MIENFDDILLELSYRVGIVDLTKEHQVTELINILKENGYDDAFELGQKARVYFSYLNEAKQDIKQVLAKTFTNPDTGNDVMVATALGYDKKSRAYGIAKGMFKSAGYSDKDIDMVDVGPEDEEKPKKSKSTKTGTKQTSAPKVDIDVTGAEKKKDKTPTKSVDVEKGTAVKVAQSKYDKKGSVELDQKKATNRLKNLPPSGISPKQALKNFKSQYPDGITTNYNYPSEVDELLQQRLPPAGYDTLKSLMMMSKMGTFEPPISSVTDQYGAGQISAQANELAMQAVYCFSNTKEGMAARDKFIKSLVENAKNIKQKGGIPILDESWIKHLAGAHDAFIANMDRQYGAGNWEITGMTWDNRAQQESLGANYDDKGDSTDINAQIKVGGKIINKEISCKKDWEIYLLNAGLGDAQNWYYTLGKDKEIRAEELSRMKEAKDPAFTKSKELQAELREYDQEALRMAPVKNSDLQKNQMKSCSKGFDKIKTNLVSPKDWKKAEEQCLAKGKNDFSGVEKNDLPYIRAVQSYMTKGKKPLTEEGLREHIKQTLGDGSEKAYKKSVLTYNKVLAQATGDTKWLSNHRKITEDFVKDAAVKMATDKDFQDMLLRKLQEAIPVRTMLAGIEDMQIDGMYITKEHMVELFGTDNWDDVKQYLTIKVIDGEASLVYLAKGKKPEQPIKIADIGLREKGVGYNGSIGLLCEPTKDFEKACREIDGKLNKKK